MADDAIGDPLDSQHPAPRLIAQSPAEGFTAKQGRKDGEDGVESCSSRNPRRHYFTSARWTADGTSIIATLSDYSVGSFVLPSDLLEEADKPRHLDAQGCVRLPEPTQAIAAAPYFSLAEPASQIFLAACRDHPLHMYQAFPDAVDAPPIASYKLIKQETEEYIAPSSLLWQTPGTHFVCGSSNRLDYFDVSRSGSDGPVLTIPTIPSRRHISKGSGVGMRGTVSALAQSPASADGQGSVVAAGTRTRWIGLYDLNRSDKVVANWTVADADRSTFGTDLGGQGIVQMNWTPCGRYLIINERHADGLLVYDVRGAGELLTILRGRRSGCQQRMTCDVYQGGLRDNNSGSEVWAGAEDGSIAVWEQVGMDYGVKEPSWGWTAHEAPVGATLVHPSGSVVATCAGAWRHIAEDEVLGEGNAGTEPQVLEESSLKVWSVGC
jgi:hypothetical protein